jgi:Protein of unknown function DUF262/Protein of unknown function (DUF1524)
LNELLIGRLFRIPDYQRAYAWEKKQRDELFEDIEEVQRSGQDHFMATVVCLARGKRSIGADEFTVAEVVDGQQRLTTFVVLLKAVEKILSAEDKLEAKIKAEIIDLLVKADDHALVLLQTNHDSSSVFLDYIRVGVIQPSPALTAADKNLIDAAHECEAFVKKWAAHTSPVELVALLRNRLSMIYHELTDEASVYRVFEVLNSRGLDVRWIDKCKSQLMGLVFQNADTAQRVEVLREMHVIWQDIYRILGLRGDLGDDALRFAGTLRADEQKNRLLSQEDAATTLVQRASSNLTEIIDQARWLKSVVSIVHLLDSNARLKAVTRIVHARFLAVSILLKQFPKEIEESLLGYWERLTFRIFALGEADTRNKNGDYVRLAYDVFTDNLHEAEILARMRAIGQDFPIEKVMTGVKDYYHSYEGWTEELRYLLFRYDEYLAKEAGEKINQAEWIKIWAVDPSKSIEHIKPQSSQVGYVHHVGNLTMLPPGMNYSLQDKPPKQKAASYVECGIRATRDVGKTIRAGAWDEKAVLARAKKIERFILKEWAD